jgi:hypothetical protein
MNAMRSLVRLELAKPFDAYPQFGLISDFEMHSYLKLMAIRIVEVVVIKCF